MLRRVSFLVPVLFAFPLLAQEFFPAAPREVLVKFRAQPLTVIQQVERDEDIEMTRHVGGAGTLLLRSRSKDALTLVRRLLARTDVLYAEPNYILHAIATPNDPRFPELWGLQNTGQYIQGVAGKAGADIGAVPAWDLSTGSADAVVAVVDTGIDYTHPDLAANVWSAPAAFTVTVGGQTITCAAGTHGFNAITNTCDPMDDNDHGTHVSGTIGAAGNNGIGVVGVNWMASIMGAKFLDKNGSGYTSDAIDAIEFAIQARAAFGSAANVRVLSNSWGGGGFSQALLDEINLANSYDMLFVAAAGNSGRNNDATPSYPASYNAPNVVAVAATDNRDGLASWSNYGASSVDLGAPGVNILSTVRSAGYSYFSGTSMATPHVSGAAALVLSRCSLNTADLKSNLLNNVDPISSLASKTLTGGRLNVNKAIRACSAPPPADFSLSATPPSQTVASGASTTYAVTVIPSGGFTGTVSFSVSGLPAGASAGFNPVSVSASGSSTMSVSTSSSTPGGTYALVIAGISGALTHTTAATLVVSAPAPDFSLSATPASQTVSPGGITTYTVTATPVGSFNGTVTFSVSGLPKGATGSFSPASVTRSGSSTLTVKTGASTRQRTYALTITGASGSLVRRTSVSLVVLASAH